MPGIEEVAQFEFCDYYHLLPDTDSPKLADFDIVVCMHADDYKRDRDVGKFVGRSGNELHGILPLLRDFVDQGGLLIVEGCQEDFPGAEMYARGDQRRICPVPCIATEPEEAVAMRIRLCPDIEQLLQNCRSKVTPFEVECLGRKRSWISVPSSHQILVVPRNGEDMAEGIVGTELALCAVGRGHVCTFGSAHYTGMEFWLKVAVMIYASRNSNWRHLLHVTPELCEVKTSCF
eukprot:TRINITY_DN97746_c0_g1_i1.p1 TRINITY_DN97746_c0_g1~~TRINITY_DN97746_c0_g1_i1.p1  ORF type:complete len:233 (-),score=26.57 TRINITY_DN97746_c0_g1_i1:61-759(-)